MTDAQREAQRRYRERHPEKVKENRKRYLEKNKEKVLEYQRKLRQENPEKYKEIARKYYQEHKEKCNEYSRQYTKKNRDKVTKMLTKRRKEVAMELASKGQIYTYLPKTARESKMINSLANKLNISKDKANQILVANDWNYVKIIEDSTNASKIQD